MNLPEYSLSHPKIIGFFLAVILVGGAVSFDKLAKKEDSPFVIKSAALVTSFPGATPQEVERLVTEPIEREVQQMRNLYKIKSDSYFGMSKIMVELDPATAPRHIPQLWDELRRRVSTVQPTLPQGCSSINVADDFGDVYGMYYGLSADAGFGYEELREWAQYIKNQLVTIDGVVKVALYGVQNQVVNLRVNPAKMTALGISPEEVIQTVQSQNRMADIGQKEAGNITLEIIETGTYKTLDDIGNQLITTKSGTQVRLGDLAQIEFGYQTPPSTLMRVNTRKAIGIGVSTAPDRDVVKIGDQVAEKLNEIVSRMPVGIDLTTLYPENTIAREANNTFIINLLESVLIVVGLIMLFLGMRSGVLIGSSLLFSIAATLLLMQFMGEGLNRTSLAGFIIAMGMLVDNAIVVTDNALNGMRRGQSKAQALVQGALLPQWGLLGATLIAVFSFLPLYLAPRSVAEIVKPLFVVLAISLIMSWVLALTQTVSFGNYLLKMPKSVAEKPLYSGAFYGSFARLLRRLIRWRWLTLGAVIVLFIGAMALMGALPKNFFPNLDKPYFRGDCFFPDGYTIQAADTSMQEIEHFLMEQPEVKCVSVTVGASPLRYYLASSSFGPKPNFAALLVELHDKSQSAEVEERLNRYVSDNYPDIILRSALFKLSPAVEAAIEIGFEGERIDTLLRLTAQAADIMREVAHVEGVRNSWGNQVPVWNPQFSQNRGIRAGITRYAMAQGMTIATNGYQVGVFRHEDRQLPILIKDENVDSYGIENLRSIPLFGASGMVVPLEQVTRDFTLSFDFSTIKRTNNQRIMMAQCDPVRGANTQAEFQKIYDACRQRIVVPDGYKMGIFGEQESEADTNQAIGANVPLTFILIVAILVILFGSYRKPLAVLLMIPLIFIGVVLGLVLFGKMFDFFAMLGLLGLVGMNIKNAIVLVDQIGLEYQSGNRGIEGVIAATQSRVVPVVIASGTTILGMLPLLFDAMFSGMAATIMGGLFAATFLTILILPVTYCTLLGIKE